MVCGLALPHDQLPDDWRDAVPIGTEKFQQAFLDMKLQILTRRFRTLTALADQLEGHGKHMMLPLMRTSLLSAPLYLLQCLPLHLTRPWAASIDCLVQAHLWRHHWHWA